MGRPVRFYPRNGRRSNRTPTFFVMRLRFGITANTKRSVFDRTPRGYGRRQPPRRATIADNHDFANDRFGDPSHGTEFWDHAAAF
jgi:hypothetical protein